jgi:hypothetical protein
MAENLNCQTDISPGERNKNNYGVQSMAGE